ncbi:MAG: hypothetical protein Q9217_004785 [Psora testacea]
MTPSSSLEPTQKYNYMDPLTFQQRQPAKEAIENWDDDEDLQGIDDLQFRNVSSTTIGSNQMHRRDSISSRMSTRSDRESVGGGDEDWQVLLPTDDEKSTADAISSAKSAGIPIPRNVPTSALLGGTIKRLGGRRLKKVLGDDWGDDIELPKPQDGRLKLKKEEGSGFPETLKDFSAEFSTSPSPSKPQSNMGFMDRLASATKARTRTATLAEFKDDEGDDFGDVPTIKIAKSRTPQKPMVFKPPPDKPTNDAESMEDDLELPDGKPLKLTLRRETPRTPASNLTDDLDMDWAEGSLGTRFGGTRRDMRSNPSSSISAFSPSASSCLTAESEDDALDGLVLPDTNFNLGEALKKRMENGHTKLSEPAFENLTGKAPEKKDVSTKDDFFSGIDIGDGEVFDSGKLTLNRNIKQKAPRQKSPNRRPATTLTFTNKVEPGVSKIPRPQSHDRPRSTLEPVAESGPAPQYRRPGSRTGGHSSHSSLSSAIPTPSTSLSFHNATPSTPSRRPLNAKTSRDMLRAENTTHPSNYLRAKRSMPAMTKSQPSPSRQPTCQRPPSRGCDFGGSRPAIPSRPKTPIDRSGAESSMSNVRRPPVPFLPAGTSSAQSHHVSIKTSRHFNRPNSSDSNDNAPINRPLSRVSHSHRPSTPTNRRDHAPEALTREAASKRTLTKPTRRRQFGDGNELEVFDDLPTSASIESKYTKQPVARGAPKSVQMRSKLGLQHPNASSASLNEPLPPQTPCTPLSPIKHDPVPRFARDTNASRLAREQRIGLVSATLQNTPSLPAVRESGVSLSSISTNWKPTSHISHKDLISPMPHSKRRPRAPPQKPRLIKPMGEIHNHPKEEKGMQWNPLLFRWEGNENALAPFDVHATSTGATGLASPKSPANGKAAPALIANVGASKGVQMSGGMVFDPQRMCWLKAAPSEGTTRSDSNPLSPATYEEEEEDPFAGFEDLDDAPKGSKSQANDSFDGFGGALPITSASPDTRKGKALRLSEDVEPLVVGEEFDVGPEFVRRLRAEEERWRSKVDGWVGDDVKRDDGDRSWRWAIREKAMGLRGEE